MTDFNDREAMADLLEQGDENAWRVFSVAAADKMMRIALLRLRKSDLAEDAVQDVLRQVYKNPTGMLRAFREGKDMRYMCASIDNRCRTINYREGQAHRAGVSIGAPETGGCSEDQLPESEEETPDNQLVRAEEAELVRQAVSQLPDDQRLVVILRVYETMTYREIEFEFGIPESTARSRFGAALLKLFESLNHLKLQQILKRRECPSGCDADHWDFLRLVRCEGAGLEEIRKKLPTYAMLSEEGFMRLLSDGEVLLTRLLATDSRDELSLEVG